MGLPCRVVYYGGGAAGSLLIFLVLGFLAVTTYALPPSIRPGGVDGRRVVLL